MRRPYRQNYVPPEPDGGGGDDGPELELCVEVHPRVYQQVADIAPLLGKLANDHGVDPAAVALMIALIRSSGEFFAIDCIKYALKMARTDYADQEEFLRGLYQGPEGEHDVQLSLELQLEEYDEKLGSLGRFDEELTQIEKEHSDRFEKHRRTKPWR
jgi:hypothetical protein